MQEYTHRDHRGLPYFIGKDADGNDQKQAYDAFGHAVPFEESQYTPVQELYRNMFAEAEICRQGMTRAMEHTAALPDYARAYDKHQMLSWLLVTIRTMAGMTVDEANALVADLKSDDR